jgi:hypothetical protein
MERRWPLCGETIVVEPNQPEDFQAHLDMDQLLLESELIV